MRLLYFVYFCELKIVRFFSANDDKKDETQIDGVDDGVYLHLGSSR